MPVQMNWVRQRALIVKRQTITPSSVYYPRIIEHYNKFQRLDLDEQQKNDLAEYLKSL